MSFARCFLVSTVALVAFGATTASARPDIDRVQLKRQAIDEMAGAALRRLLIASPRARELADRAVAYAVFDSFKVSLLLSAGSGVGVAVNDQTGQSTYMRMGTGGVGLGIGGQSYQTIFLFEDLATYERFVTKGWQADLTANAAAGTAGKNGAQTFTRGVAIFQLTHKGLLAQAGVSGTKYWRSKKLNPM